MPDARTSAYSQYAQNLTSNHGHKSGLSILARVGTFVVAELAINAVIRSEFGSKVLSGPAKMAAMFLGASEEVLGFYAAAKLSSFVGDKIDAWQERQLQSKAGSRPVTGRGFAPDQQAVPA